MILLNDFYRIKERSCTADAISCKVELVGEHAIYKAHFPNSPVTPGACLLQMVTELLQQITPEPLRLVNAKRIKYKNVVKPSVTLWFEISRAADDNGCYRVNANINGEDKVFAQMALTYRKVNE